MPYIKCPECGDRFDEQDAYECAHCHQKFCDDFCLDDHKCPAEAKEEKAEGEEKKPIATIKGGKTKSGEEED